MDIYKKLKELHIVLPNAPAKGGVYTPAKEFGENLVYVSGCGNQRTGGTSALGKLGATLTLEQGQEAARDCMLNVLAVLHQELGDLNRIKSFVKLLAFVASSSDFTMQPTVANGGSQLILDIFGEAACPARSAIGVNVLPGNIPVEIEALVELKPL